jgi:hypothetical protein
MGLWPTPGGANPHPGRPRESGNPLRALKGFARLHLAPDETRHVAFELNLRDLSQATEKGEHRIMPGSYTAFVGGSQPTGVCMVWRQSCRSRARSSCRARDHEAANLI